MQYPIDAIDAGSQIHDAFYWKVGASGWQSAITDLRTWTADRDLAKAGYKAWGNAILGNIDPVSHRDYTAKETLWSVGVALGFTIISAEKSFRIGVNQIIGLFTPGISTAPQTPIGYQNIDAGFASGFH